MFVDASAMVAMLTDEPEGDRLARILEGASTAITSAIAIYETGARLMSKSSLSGEKSSRARRFSKGRQSASRPDRPA